MSQDLGKNKLFSGIFKLITVFVLLGLLMGYLAPFVHPNTFWPIAFFGLVYPVILVIAIVLLIGFAIKLSRWALVIAVFLILGGKLHFRLLSLGGKEMEPVEVGGGLKVMSYNVRLFSLYTPSEEERNVNRQKIFNFLKTERPDVVCFQEFYQHEKSTSFPTLDSLVPLLEIKDYQERYVSRKRGRHNFGITTLSKYPIISKGEVPLQEEYDVANANFCIFSDIVKGVDTFRVYNVHLQSIKLKADDIAIEDENMEGTKGAVKNVVKKLKEAYQLRADQARKVVEHSKESPYPVIICGDFNDTPMSYTYNQFLKAYVDSYRETTFGVGSTYAGRIPAGRIDYIFHSKELHAEDFKIQTEKLSDHYAISCIIHSVVSD